MLDFTIAELEFTVDAGRWGFSHTPALDEVSCTHDIECADLAQLCTTGDCVGFCRQQTCELHAPFTLWREVLPTEKAPELISYDAEDVIIRGGSVVVEDNTFAPTLDAVTLFVAPAGVIKPEPPQAVPLVTVSLQGFTAYSWDEDDIAAASALAPYLEDASQPFNILVAGVVEVKAGQATPTGRVAFSLDVQASAQR